MVATQAGQSVLGSSHLATLVDGKEGISRILDLLLIEGHSEASSGLVVHEIVSFPTVIRSVSGIS